MKEVEIERNCVAEKIKSIPNGKFFNLTFLKKDGTLRTAVAQKGVRNPKDMNKTPKGTGESADEALSNGRVKYYEPNHKNDDGSVTGEYRQASISRIISFTHPDENCKYTVK